MKISFVSVEDGLTSIGFRKMASIVRTFTPDTQVYYIVPENLYSPLNWLKPKSAKKGFSDEDLEKISKELVKADMVCFSSMTPFADITKHIIEKIRTVNPKIYIIWGGVHPIVSPDDAILYADAICTGEGEYAFQKFFSAFNNGNDFTETKNFWFNEHGKIIKNNFLPLQTNEEMDKLPHPLYGKDEIVFRKGSDFERLDDKGYLSFNGLAYNTVWSIGCPYLCTYCSNSKFIDNDTGYRRLRHSSVNNIISEIKNVLKVHPHVSTICFHDDGFLALPYDVLEEFSNKWRKEVNTHFAVFGINPNAVKREKIELLVSAGMNRVRMGIQSGSEKMLRFYKRPGSVKLIKRATSTIGDFTKYMIPPAYDIILDNPLEDRDDILATLELVYNMPRPFTLNIYALRVIPNTELAHDFQKANVPQPGIDEDYFGLTPTIANITIYLLAVYRPPRWIFDYLLKYAKPHTEKQFQSTILLVLFKFLFLFDRAFSHLRYMDFSVIPGKTGWLLWKLGIIKFWQSKMLLKLK